MELKEKLTSGLKILHYEKLFNIRRVSDCSRISWAGEGVTWGGVGKCVQFLVEKPEMKRRMGGLGCMR